MGRFARIVLAGVLASLVSAAPPPAIEAGTWQVRSTIVTLDAAGVPGFLQRMAKGHATTERKCVVQGGTVAALLAPDPKARCHVDRADVAGGRYAQTLSCPQKRGDPIVVTRTGTYDDRGFVGHANVNGITPRGPISITLTQQAVRTTGTC